MGIGGWVKEPMDVHIGKRIGYKSNTFILKDRIIGIASY